jgi:hypothetical protein
VPADKPVIVVLSPVPVVVVPSFRVKVHVPMLGKPFNTTLPVAMLQVGWVIVPTKGVFRIPTPSVLMVIFAVADDTQAVLRDTVKV